MTAISAAAPPTVPRHIKATKWWPQARHDVRDVYEGALATLLVKSLLANWKKAHGDRVGAVRLVTAPLLIIAAALPVVVAGIWVINFAAPWLWHHTVGHHVLHLTVGMPAWLGTFLSTWTWQPLLIGILAGLVVHRLYRPIGDTVQLFFIELGVNRARSTGNIPAWVRYPITPPVIRERFAWMMDNACHARKQRRCPAATSRATAQVWRLRTASLPTCCGYSVSRIPPTTLLGG